METRVAWMDGNEAAASAAYRLNEVIALYPITPASPMGETCDTWSSQGRTNLFGTVPEVVEMQSEAGAAGAVHGALQAGSLTTTFTASQGLLLMLPDMYKIAGELLPCVIHVAARTVATHALSIFGDHSDVMAARATGWAMLCASSVQEAHDFAAVAQAAALKGRVPFLHFFDGFRTSHEVNRVELLSDEDLRSLLDPEALAWFRGQALDPDHPVLRGSAQNPDVFFQAREACNPFYERLPGLVRDTLAAFAERTGRRYRLFDYHGAADAERVLVVLGSAAGAVREAVDLLNRRGERVGLIQVRLYRPWSAGDFLAALPPTVERVAVLDRTKEPGAAGEPLFLDVAATLAEAGRGIRVLGGRYGLSSKEFTPAMAAAVFEELSLPEPKRRFTVGIRDDVTRLSLAWDPEFQPRQEGIFQAVLHGLGSDGTVGAAKNTVKIVGEATGLHAQGYFVYDSRKAGSRTISHLRFGPEPIHSSYLVDRADFVACHQWSFLERYEVLDRAAPGATFLLNCPYPPEEAWEHLPLEVQERILELGLRVWVVDGHGVARAAGLGNRINTVMQTCFFALTDLLPVEEAKERIREAIRKTYGRRGQTVLDRNFAAVDGALDALRPLEVDPARHRPEGQPRRPVVPEDAPDFVQRVTRILLEDRGDLLPVSALPADGSFPTGTTRYEKRAIAQEIPIWEPDLCIDCALCSFVCPHAAIRMKVFEPEAEAGAPEGWRSKPWKGKDLPGARLAIQVAPEDCTGCGICVEVCPARSKEEVKRKAINMESMAQHRDREARNFDFFLGIPDRPRAEAALETVQGTQQVEPLFEFSGACAGCGETPYLKLLTQLFGDRLLVANATGCSSIYGGNLPTTPWAMDRHGRGPAWANSLFEDNAEFGLGIRLGLEGRRARARALLEARPEVPRELLEEVLAHADAVEAAEVEAQRRRLEHLRELLGPPEGPEHEELHRVLGSLAPRSVWIVGGDGWAYDIGFGGLDHVLASNRNVNLLVLDTAVYSNTGGQASKATPRAAVARFAAGGKETRRKDLGILASLYGHVYVAQVAMGANPRQTIQAFLEAEAWPGPSLILAYSHCIAHGLDIRKGMEHQKLAAQTGFWPLFRYDPRRAHAGDHPFQLDSRKPRKPFTEFARLEGRFAMLERVRPEEARRLLAQASHDLKEQWRLYTQLAGIERELDEEADAPAEEVKA